MNQAILITFQDADMYLQPWAESLGLKFSNTKRGHDVAARVFTSENSPAELRQSLKEYSADKTIDALILDWPLVFPKLLVMDMDSTLVDAETIDQIAEIAGAEVGAQVAEVTASAMRGELDFQQSLIARVSKLKGLTLDELKQVHERLPLMPGAREMLEFMHSRGCHTALVSGGFTLFAEPLADSIGIKEVHANTLEFKDGKLTGHVVGEIVDGAHKERVLKSLSNKLNLKREEIWAIGDGANDLPMLGSAGVGIAYHAKPKVNQEADHAIRYEDLTALKRLLMLA